MATFARPTFFSAGYAAFRPSYSEQLFQTALNYAGRTTPNAASGALLDLGCGHGNVARALAPSFSSVVALDRSPGMVEQAKALTTDPNVTIREGACEDLFFLPDNSIDCVVSGSAAHWFDFGRLWPEMARVVKSGGALAFWGYKDHVILGHPSVANICSRYVYAESDPVPGMHSLMRYWEMPGGQVLRDSYRAIVPPEKDWEDVERIAWDPDKKTADLSDAPKEALWQRKRLSLGELAGFMRTYSSYGGWKDAHPETMSRAEGGSGDILDRMWDEAVNSVPEWKASGDKWTEIEVDVVWGTVLLMARRR